MKVCVVDASVAAKWFVEEQFTDEALILIKKFDLFHAPDFTMDWQTAPSPGMLCGLGIFVSFF